MTTTRGFRVLVDDTIVKDHRKRPRQEGRRYAAGEVITLDDLADTARYPDHPDPWQWVWSGLVEPVGWPRYRVVREIEGTGRDGWNPHGFLRVGGVITPAHVARHVNFAALVDGGHLERIEDETSAPQKE